MSTPVFFRQALLPISSLFISIAFLATGYGMLMTYIGLYLKQAGPAEMAIGMINSGIFSWRSAGGYFQPEIDSKRRACPQLFRFFSVNGNGLPWPHLAL